MHCVAGDATGIILAAAVTAVPGLPMWADLLVEYVSGFLFGLLIFQALFMRATMGGTYAENVRRSFISELVSMNAMMAGMAPVMITLIMRRDMRAMWPGEPLFWFVMSMGIIVGFALAYPVNVWLVARQLKHGLMTVRRHDMRENAHARESGADQMGAMGMAGGMDRQGASHEEHSPEHRRSSPVHSLRRSPVSPCSCCFPECTGRPFFSICG